MTVRAKQYYFNSDDIPENVTTIRDAEGDRWERFLNVWRCLDDTSTNPRELPELVSLFGPVTVVGRFERLGGFDGDDDLAARVAQLLTLNKQLRAQLDTVREILDGD